MTTLPNNVIFRKDLTDYAFALMPDVAKVNALANMFAPVVPTGVMTGRYNTFSDLNSFRTYASTLRSIGGQANAIGFLSDTEDFACKANGLRIGIDGQERTNAAAAITLLEQGKVRTLQLACANSRLANVITTVKASIAATANKGSWSNANVDPIVELDSQIEAIWTATGMVPNKIVMDLSAWMILKNNPNVLKRMPGADLQVVNPDRISALLYAPNIQLVISDVALYATRTAEAANTKKGVLNSSCFIFHSSEMATQYDPSFCKTFAPSSTLFTGIYTWEEAPHVTWYENDWTEQIKVVSTALCKRIDVA